MLQTDWCEDIAMVTIGAMFVGKIIQTFIPNKTYKKGDEMGYFAFGGSTVVLLFKKGVLKIDQKFVDHSRQNIETVVKMGERVGQLLPKETS